MKLELKEHELERVIEVYLQLQFNKQVHVNGFDLSGMRSKDGLSALVDFTLVGESDAREPKLDSPNVNVTNTAWREERKQEQKQTTPALTEEELADWKQFLELITDNAQYKNYDNILDLLESTTDTVKAKIEGHSLFIDMVQGVEESINKIVKDTLNNTSEETEIETEEVEVQVEPEIVVEHAEAIKEEMEHKTVPVADEPVAVETEEVQPEPEPKPEKKNIFGARLGSVPTNVHNQNGTLPSRRLFGHK